MATNGGNLMQRTRCALFLRHFNAVQQTAPGPDAAAMQRDNRNHAIFGWTEKCVAVNPSDMCVALCRLDAVVKVQTPAGTERSIPFAEFHRLPGDTPEKDKNLQHGELITAIEIPRSVLPRNSYYLKVRDRASYAFALVSVAAALEMSGQTIKQVRIAMGGVAHKPWRATRGGEISHWKTGDRREL